MAFRSEIFSLLLPLLLLHWVSGEVEVRNHCSGNISLGCWLPSKANGHPRSWQSPSQIFEFGFYDYKQGGEIFVGIWLRGDVEDNKTVVWTANRDEKPITSNAVLVLTEEGIVVITTKQVQRQISNTTGAAYASMLDSGNFVIYNKHSQVIWQTFDHPTDTILGNQSLWSGGELVSSLSEIDPSTGRFHLVMQGDSNLVSYPLNNGDQPADAYWSSDTYSGEPYCYLYLSETGYLAIINTADLNRTVISLHDTDESTERVNKNQRTASVYRAKLDLDGVFRLYYHTLVLASDDTTSHLHMIRIVWESLEDPCQVKASCGFNSFCTSDDTTCRCLPGTNFINPNQNHLGCHRNFSHPGCKGREEINPAMYKMAIVENISWGDNPYSAESISMEDCNHSCLQDCNCGAALYDHGNCQKYSLPVRYARRRTSMPLLALIKTGTTSIEPPPPVAITSRKAVTLILIITVGFVASACSALAVAGFFVYKYRVLMYKRLLEDGVHNLGLTEDLTLRLFTYNELKKATNGFKEQLGRGAFGTVYKGTLFKGNKLVAVKRLEKAVEEGTEKQFRAEMRAIGKAHHRNLVRLVGYCVEDSKRLLVYEYMSNGSLANLLFGEERRLYWADGVRIALEVARGIFYLHEECGFPIIHCDIKPQNILMDTFWTAKISDFGLAKLLMPDQTRTLTGARGTMGYIAPEWKMNIPISIKADVYSYGIVLLEIICCRRNLEVNVAEPEQIVLSNWAYKCFIGRELNKLVDAEEVDQNILENMVKVGLWCIQDEPALRPSMKNVVLMLQGIIETPVPPCPATTST